MKYIRNIVLLITSLMIIININISYAENKTLSLEYDGKIHIYTAEPIILEIDGEKIETLMPPIILDGRTLVPARDVFEKLGAKVQWDEKYKQVYITYQNKIIILKIDNKTVYVNQLTNELDVPAKIINNKTMIPVAFVAKSLGFKVDWNDKSRLVSIKKSNNNQIPEDNSKTEGNTNTEPSTYDLSKESLTWEFEGDTKKAQKLSTISSKEYDDTNVTDFKFMKVDDACYNLLITADDKISNIKKSITENKITIDIENAILDFDSSKLIVPDNNFVNKISATQIDTDPNKIRIIIELKNKINYDVKLSDNRKNIQISFLKNEVNKLKLYQNDDEYILRVEGIYTPYANVFKLDNPQRLVADIAYSDSNLVTKSASIKSDLISAIRTSQFDKNTTRVVLDFTNQFKHEVQYTDSTMKIVIKKSADASTPTYNIDKVTKLTFSKTDTTNIDVSKVTAISDYLNHKLVITFPGDYSKEIGSKIVIDDSRIVSTDISKVGKNTTITINYNSILEGKISEDQKHIFIELLKPRQKYNKIVVVDAGHGGSDPGAKVGSSEEKNINLAIAKKTQELLEKDSDIKVYVTRVSDVYPTLGDRVRLAEDVGADIFVSIHNNASLSTKANGTETLYYPMGVESNGGLTSIKLAQILEDNVCEETGSYNRGVIPRPDLYVLNSTTMPAALVEVGYMTNEEELAKLLNKDYTDAAGKAIYDGIKQVFKQYGTNR